MENKYYLIELADGDEAIKGNGIYVYDTQNEAIANFHSKIGTAMKSNKYTKQTVVVMNGTGGTIAKNYYEAPIVVAE